MTITYSQGDTDGGHRLIDQDWFNEWMLSVAGFFNHQRLYRLKSALEPITARNNDQATVDRCKTFVKTWWRIDNIRRDEKWCAHGFRHRINDDAYSTGSTMGVLETYYQKLPPSKCLCVRDRDLRAPKEWCDRCSLYNLRYQIDALARMCDTVMHAKMDEVLTVRIPVGAVCFDDREREWNEVGNFWMSDVIATSCLETSLKTLWHIEHPGTHPAEAPTRSEGAHNLKWFYEQLENRHDEIKSYAYGMPILAQCLKVREEGFDAIDHMFEWLLDGNQEWIATHYSHAETNWPPRMMAPFWKFVTAVGVYFVAIDQDTSDRFDMPHEVSRQLQVLDLIKQDIDISDYESQVDKRYDQPAL